MEVHRKIERTKQTFIKEKKEYHFPSIDIQSTLTNDFRLDIECIVEHPNFSIIAHPENQDQFSRAIEEVTHCYKEIYGVELPKEKIEKMLRYAQLGFLIDRAVLSLLSGNPMTKEEFERSIVLIARRKMNQSRLIVAYSDLLTEYELDRKTLSTKKSGIDIVHLLEWYSSKNEELQETIKALKFLQDGIKTKTIVSRVQGIEDISDGINITHLPFADIIAHDTTRRFTYVGIAAEKPVFVDKNNDVHIPNLVARGADHAEIYLSQSQGRYLVVSQAGSDWYREPKRAHAALRHEIEHVVSRMTRPEMRDNTFIDYDEKIIEEKLRIEELFLIDELGAWCAQGEIDGIDQNVYFGKSCRRLENSVDKDVLELGALAESIERIDIFKEKWRRVIDILKPLQELIKKDRASILMVHHVVARVRNVDELYENLDILSAWLAMKK